MEEEILNLSLLLTNSDSAVLSCPECQKGTVGTLLMENPVGQNGLTYKGLLHETAKVFGLRSRRLKLFLDEALTHGKHKPLVCLSEDPWNLLLRSCCVT